MPRRDLPSAQRRDGVRVTGGFSPAGGIIGAVSEDRGPGREVDGWQQLKFAIAELSWLVSALGTVIGADSEAIAAATWDGPSWRAADLYERAVTDLGTLSAQYVRMAILDRRGIDPLGLDGNHEGSGLAGPAPDRLPGVVPRLAVERQHDLRGT